MKGKREQPIQVWSLQSILRILADANALGFGKAAEKHGCSETAIRGWNRLIWAAKASAPCGPKPVTLPQLNASTVSQLEAEIERLRGISQRAMDRAEKADFEIRRLRENVTAALC